jgi:hypothetical protein
MKQLFIAIILLGSTYATAQKNNGFYGKKFFIQPEFLINTPLAYNLFSNDFDNPYLAAAGTTGLITKRDLVNVGYRVTAGYALKRNMALGIEVGQDFSSFYPNRYSYINDPMGYSYSVEIEHEMVDITTMNIIPKMEFANSNSLLPMGLSHTVGFGISLTKMVEKNYVYRNLDYYMGTAGIYNYQNSSTDPIEISKYPPLRKFVILYAINMRTPITKNILISYGLKYTLNVGGRNGYSEPGVNQLMSSSYIIDEMNRQRKLSFINANVGLVYSF